MLIKNLEWQTLVTVLPLHLTLMVGLVGMLLISGRVKKAITVARTMQWNLFHLRNTLAARAAVKRLRVRRDREFLPALIRSPELRRSLISMAWFVDRRKWDQR